MTWDSQPDNHRIICIASKFSYRWEVVSLKRLSLEVRCAIRKSARLTNCGFTGGFGTVGSNPTRNKVFITQVNNLDFRGWIWSEITLVINIFTTFRFIVSHVPTHYLVSNSYIFSKTYLRRDWISSNSFIFSETDLRRDWKYHQIPIYFSKTDLRRDWISCTIWAKDTC